jgi:hypothetical protein
VSSHLTPTKPSLFPPQVFLSADDAHLHLRALRLLYAACSLASLGLMLLWYLIFVKATLATGRTLRQQPYMQTRSQQLSYRFFVQQVPPHSQVIIGS